MAGRIGNFVWCCGTDLHADDYTNSLRTGNSRFGSCFLLPPEKAEILCHWMRIILD
jgi:hypothetical protein